MDKIYNKNNDVKKTYNKKRIKINKNEEILIINNYENFPELNDNSLINKTDEYNNKYLETIKYNRSNISNNINDRLVPKGWILLNDIIKNEKKEIKEVSEYYNPYNSYKIIEDRSNEREELNDILGDISPYWNIEEYEIDDETENETEEDYDDKTEDEEYYNEEWY